MSSEGPTPSRLDAADIEAIAVRVAELVADLRGSPQTRLVDAATVADMLAVDRDWVYENAERLGAIRLGGQRGRLRFDIVALHERLALPAEAPLAVKLASRRRNPRNRTGGS